VPSRLFLLPHPVKGLYRDGGEVTDHTHTVCLITEDGSNQFALSLPNGLGPAPLVRLGLCLAGSPQGTEKLDAVKALRVQLTRHPSPRPLTCVRWAFNLLHVPLRILLADTQDCGCLRGGKHARLDKGAQRGTPLKHSRVGLPRLLTHVDCVVKNLVSVHLRSPPNTSSCLECPYAGFLPAPATPTSR